jgi:heme/copper-type cytochrome/quinol oxidase subunit 2
VLSGVVGIVGIVIFYAVLRPFGANNDSLGNTGIIGNTPAYPLIIILPIVLAAGIIIYVLLTSFSARR